jgi:hypothetical protein
LHARIARRLVTTRKDCAQARNARKDCSHAGIAQELHAREEFHVRIACIAEIARKEGT